MTNEDWTSIIRNASTQDNARQPEKLKIIQKEMSTLDNSNVLKVFEFLASSIDENINPELTSKALKLSHYRSKEQGPFTLTDDSYIAVDKHAVTVSSDQATIGLTRSVVVMTGVRALDQIPSAIPQTEILDVRYSNRRQGGSYDKNYYYPSRQLRSENVITAGVYGERVVILRKIREGVGKASMLYYTFPRTSKPEDLLHDVAAFILNPSDELVISFMKNPGNANIAARNRPEGYLYSLQKEGEMQAVTKFSTVGTGESLYIFKKFAPLLLD